MVINRFDQEKLLFKKIKLDNQHCDVCESKTIFRKSFGGFLWEKLTTQIYGFTHMF